MDDIFKVCEEGEHALDECFNVGGGAVMVGCTKCAYWEPAPESDIEIEVTYL